MNQSPFNVVSKNGINLPNEIEEKIAELSVYQRKKWEPIMDNLKVEIGMIYVNLPMMYGAQK